MMVRSRHVSEIPSPMYVTRSRARLSTCWWNN